MMSIHLPPDLDKSLKRIDNYCKLIRSMVIERSDHWKQNSEEAADRIIVEAVRISREVQEG